MKVSEYKVITGNPLPAFEEKIKSALTDGWQPLGGVSVIQLDTPTLQGQKLMAAIFSQAVVKYSE